MDTLAFLRAILPEEGYKFVALGRAGREGLAHKAYESLELMAQAIESYDRQEGLTVYHACCGYKAANFEVIVDGKAKTKFRGEANWDKAKSFWCDIDCGEDKAADNKGYTTKAEAAKAIALFCSGNGFPAPMIVDSGSGIHCYWPLTKEIGPKSWRTIASGFKAALAGAGLLVDPTRTADLSSILRPVGTHNRKPNRLVRLVSAKSKPNVVTPEQFAEAVSRAVSKYEVTPARISSGPDINDDLTAHLQPQIPSSAVEVSNHCAQVAAMRDSKGDVDYETWRGVIGIIRHCVEGVELAHEWSAERAATGHSNTDVDIRYETWDAGPTSCEFFQTKGATPAKCEGCSHNGKVKGPIMLGRIVPVSQEALVEVTTEEATVVEAIVPPFPEGYEFNVSRMLRFIKDKDGVLQPYSFCHTLFYPLQRIRKADGTFAFTIRMHLPDKRIRDFEVDTAALAASSDLLKALSKYELMPTNNKDATMHLTAYLRDSIHKLMAEQRETDTLTSFGWRDNMNGFLLGDRLYHSDGSVRKVFVGGAAQAFKDVYPEPRGTLEKYSKAVNYIYNRENSEAAQYVFCNVYGSLLTPFGEDSYNGILVAVNSSATGKGKTSVWKAALYGMADANGLVKPGKDGATRNARWGIVGAHKNVPVVFDEMTDMDAAELSNFAYTVSQGTERARMTSSGGKVGFAEQHTWKAVVGITANEDMHSKLAAHNANTQAEAVRLISINFGTYKVPIIDPALDVSDAIDVMRDNWGNAGDVFIRYVVTHKREVMDLFNKTESRLSNILPESEYRFFRSHAACTLTAAQILIDLKVVDFDYDSLEKFSVVLIQDMISTVASNNTTTPGDAIGRMLRDMSSQVIVTYGYRDLRTDIRGPEEPQSKVFGAPVGRRILSNPNPNAKEKIDPKFTNKLFIAKKEFGEWCAKNRMEPKALTDYAKAEGWLVDWPAKVNLGKGTVLSTGSCSCYAFDYSVMEGAVEVTSGSTAPQAIEIGVASSR
jgi:hypothetical protein